MFFSSRAIKSSKDIIIGINAEILYVHEGQGIVVLNNHTYPIPKGMLFFFQPYQLHHVYAEVHPDTPYARNIFCVEPIVMDRYLETFPHRRAFFQGCGKEEIISRFLI